MSGQKESGRLNLAARAERWSASHWKTAVFGWLGLCVLLMVIGSAVGTKELLDSQLGSGETARAQQILEQADFKTPSAEQVLVQSRAIKADDPRFRAAVDDVVKRVAARPEVANLHSPYEVGNQAIAPDGRSALVRFDIRGDADTAKDRVEPVLDAVAAAQRAHPGLYIASFGNASAGHELDTTLSKDFQRAEMLSIPITLLILLLAFGALVAAGIPVVLAFSGVLAALGISALVSHLVPASDSTASVILLIGMAVGVDYSLFYLRREREERAAGLPPAQALRRTAATSGQAVLISGATVLIAMAGMLFANNKIFTSIGVGAMVMVAVAMLGSLSVLPALMAKLGDRVDRGRLPLLGRRGGGESRVWAAVLTPDMRHPAISAAVSGGVLLALALPTLTLHTQLPSFTDLPKSLSIVKTYQRIQTAFPGAQTPAEVVVRAKDVGDRQVRRAIFDMELRATASGQINAPIELQENRARTVATVAMPLAGNGSDDRSKAALATLRDRIIPATVGRLPGVEVAVAGNTAATVDFNNAMKDSIPVVFAFVLSLAFVLLLLTFRSIVIPIKAIVLNLLSVGAAYGVLVLVFQHRWAEGALGFQSNGAIAAWLPLFLFVLLFGLSMDYHVFILSRVKELVDGGMPTSDAVAKGIRSTAGTVTSAAAVMVAVFAIFATLSSLDVKQMGVGLAVAVLLDATIVRAVLLPSSMKLLGAWNWYLPRWLEWLPTLAVEGAPPEPAPEPVPAPPIGAPVADPPLRIETERRPQRVTMVLGGELDLRTTRTFGDALAEVEREAPPVIVIDLRGLSFVDSSGLGQLVAATRRARSAHRRVVFVRGSKPIDRILAVSGVDHALDLTADPATLDN
jgi:RND superfamily putative drug exporter